MSEEENKKDEWETRIRKNFTAIIPKSLREKFDLKPGDIVLWKMRGKTVEVEFYGVEYEPL